MIPSKPNIAYFSLTCKTKYRKRTTNQRPERDRLFNVPNEHGGHTRRSNVLHPQIPGGRLHRVRNIPVFQVHAKSRQDQC